jgi:hypothetical protein
LLAVGAVVVLLALGVFALESAGITTWSKRKPDRSEVAVLPASTDSSGSSPEATHPDTRRETRPETRPEPRPETKPEPKATKPETKATKPEPKVTKPEPKGDPEPPGKKAVPDAEKQAEAEKQVRAAHKDEYARKKPSEQVALATRLIREGFSARGDVPMRFVLLREARDLAAQAGDLDESFRAIGEMDTWFNIDVREQRAESLDLAARTELPAAAMKTIADKAMEQAERAVDANSYELAVRMLAAAEAAARKANNTALANRAQSRSKDVAEMSKEFALVKADAETLRTQPDSAEACFRWGRFLCLFRGKWSDGLPLLAKGSDAKWKALAKKELADPAGSAEQVDLAEGWFAQAGQEKGASRKQLLMRAKHWFEQATPKLTELARFKVQKRIGEIDLETGEATPASKIGTGDKLIVTGKKYEQSMQAAKTAYEQGRFGDAAQAYGEALYWKPNDPEATAGKHDSLYASYMARGKSWMDKKRWVDAAADFNRALKEKPGDPEAKAAIEKAEAMMK